MTERKLRVLQVATLVSPDGAYGGPIRVALNQCATLSDAGHTAELAASVRGYADVPRALSGVPAHLFPARTLLPHAGFAGLTAPAMVPWFLRRRRDYDVVHVHLARDLVTLPIAQLSLRLGLPTVVQPHGMIDRSTNALARPLDAALTRPTLRAASRVFFLTDRERDELGDVSGGSIHLEHLRNGVPPPIENQRVRDARRSGLHTPEVLFLARLHPRKRATTFARAAIDLLASGCEATFSIVGPDEGEGPAVDQIIASSGFPDRIRREGALDPEATRTRMGVADIYVLPSVDEPFPMSVLEAMSESLPVVITDSCGLAPLVTTSRSGIVVDDSLDGLTMAIRRLITDSALRKTLGVNAGRTASTELSMAAVGAQLERTYHAVIADH